MEKTPLVVVEGFLGGGLGANLWKGVETLINPSHPDLDEHPEGYRRILTVSVGPVSSLHDRACELYYALRGGTVDYGSSHSSEHNHARYGRTHPTGIYPRWSKERLLHFLGHSIGGPTIIKLQHLMKEGHFGKDADPDMVLSVTSICSPFRGTQLVYTLGESTHSAPSVRPFSVGALIAKVVHLLAYIAPPTPVANDEASVDGRRSSWLEYFQVLDLHPESRSLSYRDISFLQFLRHLWRSDWAESKDATPYDMTFEAADLRESSGEGLPFPNTFYQSHVFSMTKLMSPSSGSGQNYHTPSGISWIASGPLYLMSRSIGKFDFSLIRPLPSFCVPPKSGLDPLEEFAKLSPLPAVDNRESSSILEDCMCHLDENYWANDGVVPVFSQHHPFTCHPSRCLHEGEHQDTGSHPLSPGLWVVRPLVNNRSHFFVTPPIRPKESSQSAFWEKLGCDLGAVDAQHTKRLQSH